MSKASYAIARRVCAYLLTHPDRNRTEVAAALNLTRAQVRNAVQELINRGLIEPQEVERRYRIREGAHVPSTWAACSV